jgi:CDP-glycerol glycerophosphotransferase (TagB/SpsB family)
VHRTWSEGSDISAHAVGPLLRLLNERGVQLVVKPHPMDAADWASSGLLHVTDADLARARVPLYSLLGRAYGIVTDYSSVWVDFLLLDRPMAFLVPDRDSYTRPLDPPDVLEWLPGEVVDSGERPFERFVADLDAGGALDAGTRASVADRIGLVQTRSAADDLLDALGWPSLRGSSSAPGVLRNGRSSQR